MAAVTLALSHSLLLKLEESLAKVTAPNVEITTCFFPLSVGLTPFPIQLISCPDLLKQFFKLEDLHLPYCLLQQQVVVMLHADGWLESP